MLLMNKNEAVMSFLMKRNLVEVVLILNGKLLPEMLKSGKEVAMHDWLKNRSIDLTRTNARMLLKLMGINMNDISSVLANKGLCLTDTYWIKEENSNETFEEMSLYRKNTNQRIIQTSLSGAVRSIMTLANFPKGVNPELTNIGSYNKAWIKDNNGNWWLLKSGKPKNIYAELFTFQLGKALGMNMAEYKYNYNDKGIMSKNFTNENSILEHFHSYRFSFIKDAESDIEIANEMGKKSVEMYVDYTNMLLMDAIVSNPDRHEFNFGIIKCSNSGKLKGLAPNFDNNMALGAESSLSLVPLKMYLKEFGILNHQKKMIEKLNKELIKEIDIKVKVEMDDLNMCTKYVAEYFEKVLDLLKQYED